VVAGAVRPRAAAVRVVPGLLTSAVRVGHAAPLTVALLEHARFVPRAFSSMVFAWSSWRIGGGAAQTFTSRPTNVTHPPRAADRLFFSVARNSTVPLLTALGH
jgi:hypothetical protein